MTVYVDRIRDHGDGVRGEARRYGSLWSHLTADTEEELHVFAARIGLRRGWAQHSGTHRFHYDVIPRVRAKAVAAGAIEVTDAELVDLRRRQKERLGSGLLPGASALDRSTLVLEP